MTQFRDIEDTAPAQAVSKWYEAAGKGEVVEYHEGFLMLDRLRKKSTDWRAMAFMELAERGVVRLFQKRVGEVTAMTCVYYAEKIR